MDLKENKIIAVDFDKTLSMDKWPEVGKPNKVMFKFLIEQQEKGSKIIMNTCRTGEALEKAIEFCKKNGLKFDKINENLTELAEKYENDSRKISADYYIDDKSINAYELTKQLETYYAAKDKNKKRWQNEIDNAFYKNVPIVDLIQRIYEESRREIINELFYKKFERFKNMKKVSMEEVRSSKCEDDYDEGWIECYDELKDRAITILLNDSLL